MNYLAFDLEIAKTLPQGETDWKANRPLGITCAAIYAPTFETTWGGRPQLNKMRCQNVVEELQFLTEDCNYKIITWNGLGFDFDILAEESGLHYECKELALNHIDMMFHFFCVRGHALGLDKAARGAGLEGKTEGMSGALAPDLRAQGEYDKVLEYLRQDVKTTLDLALEVEARGGEVHWISSAGKPQVCELGKWLTVKEAMELSEPDTSWMTNPWPREMFYRWFDS